jgi:MFS transporter, ACS family, hexuronate transporter
MPPLVRQMRWWILALLFVVTVIAFIDRQSLSYVAPWLRESLGLSNTDYGIIVAAFQMGMMLAEFPMGMLMDRRGVRFGLTFAAAWWSLANALHAFGSVMWQFSILRFWLGSGECGNYSGGMKVVSQWFPVRERALAIGIFNGGSMVASMIAPPLLVVLIAHFGWRSAFLLPSAMGAVWAWLWWLLYRSPEDHPKVTSAELAYILKGREPASEPPSSLALLRFRETWALMGCRMLVGPVFHFYIAWMPEYLHRERGLSLAAIGLSAWVPFLLGDAGSILGGWAAGRLIRRGFSVTATRRITMGFGAACCLLSFAVVQASTAWGALAMICIVMFGHNCLSANMYATISDLFPNNAVGRITALTGISQGVSAILFPLLTGVLVDYFSYLPVFSLAALMPVSGCLVLFFAVPRLRKTTI